MTISRIGGVPQDVYVVGGDSAPLPAGAASEATLATLLTLAGFQARVPAAKTLLTAAIAASSSGDNTLVAAVTAQRIHVVALHLSYSGAVNSKVKSGAGTDLTGLSYGATAGNGYVLPHSGDRGAWWLRTASGEALVLNLSGAVAVGGLVTYYTE